MSTETIAVLYATHQMTDAACWSAPRNRNIAHEHAEGSADTDRNDRGQDCRGFSELPSEDPGLCLYRERTVAILRKYLRLSVETGRLPSLLGREFFRTQVTSYNVCTFEDVVIFVHDVERSLAKLEFLDQELIAMIVLQEYSHGEAARLLHTTRRTVVRRFADALDRLSEIFLAGGILRR